MEKALFNLKQVINFLKSDYPQIPNETIKSLEGVKKVMEDSLKKKKNGYKWTHSWTHNQKPTEKPKTDEKS